MKTEYTCTKHTSSFKTKTCLLIVITFIIFRLILNIEFTSDKYIAAFSALGEGLNGEQIFSDAVKDAYTYAFLEDEESLVYAAGIEDEEKIKH